MGIDDAIAAAEREAHDAGVAAQDARDQYVQWTTGERQVIDSLKRIGRVIDSAAFTDVSRAFIDEHKGKFEFEDENKLEHTALHEAYVELMEKTLVAMASDVDIDALVSHLPEFMNGQALEADPEQTGATIDFLLSLTEFTTFKSMMLSARADAENLHAAPSDAVELDERDAQRAVAGLDLPAELRAPLAPLLSVDLDKGGWKKIAELGQDFVMEARYVGKERVIRMGMQVDMPPAETHRALFDLTDPRVAKRFDHFSNVHILSTRSEHKMKDSVLRLQLNMPGIVKSLKMMPDSMVVRSLIEEDQPEPGASTGVIVSWDPEKGCVLDKSKAKLRLLRIVTLRESSPGVTTCTFLETQPSFIPDWVIGVMASNSFSRQIKNAIASYKRDKAAGLA